MQNFSETKMQKLFFFFHLNHWRVNRVKKHWSVLKFKHHLLQHLYHLLGSLELESISVNCGRGQGATLDRSQVQLVIEDGCTGRKRFLTFTRFRWHSDEANTTLASQGCTEFKWSSTAWSLHVLHDSAASFPPNIEINWWRRLPCEY